MFSLLASSIIIAKASLIIHEAVFCFLSSLFKILQIIRDQVGILQFNLVIQKQESFLCIIVDCFFATVLYVGSCKTNCVAF